MKPFIFGLVHMADELAAIRPSQDAPPDPLDEIRQQLTDLTEMVKTLSINKTHRILLPANLREKELVDNGEVDDAITHYMHRCGTSRWAKQRPYRRDNHAETSAQ